MIIFEFSDGAQFTLYDSAASSETNADHEAALLVAVVSAYIQMHVILCRMTGRRLKIRMGNVQFAAVYLRLSMSQI